MKKSLATLAQLTEFDEIIDARTPAEYALDRIPGAINLPVLDNEQRITIGTLYQQSPFEARRLGAAMVAENIARHLQGHLRDKPRRWRALIYCWRGGQRSGAFTTWLRMVGWDVRQLEGGYKDFRHHVIDGIDRLAPAFNWQVICGPTGSAKTRILEALSALGAQTLDLEGLAAHKGSVLGALPDRPQPSQKGFETALHHVLQGLDPQRPVFVEAESRKIGQLYIPEALISAMRVAPCIAIDASRDTRLAYLLEDYAYLGADPQLLQANIARLSELHSRQTIARWQQFAASGELGELFAELVDQHYDPLYRRSQHGNYLGFGAAKQLSCATLDAAGIQQAAAAIVALAP